MQWLQGPRTARLAHGLTGKTITTGTKSGGVTHHRVHEARGVVRDLLLLWGSGRAAALRVHRGTGVGRSRSARPADPPPLLLQVLHGCCWRSRLSLLGWVCHGRIDASINSRGFASRRCALAVITAATVTDAAVTAMVTAVTEDNAAGKSPMMVGSGTACLMPRPVQSSVPKGGTDREVEWRERGPRDQI